MRVRITFWIILGILLIGLGGIAITKSGVFYRIVYLCVGLLVIGFFWAYFSTKGYQVNRYARGLRQQLGQIFEERFDIQNRFTFPRAWVEIEDGVDMPGSKGSKVLSWIGRRERRNYSAYSQLSRRGSYYLGPTTIRSGDPFGLFINKRVFKGTQTLIVMPYMVDLSHFPFPPGLLPGGKAQHHRTTEVTPHAAGVREYVPGDSLNRVHWAYTARKQKMMVKEFDQDPQADAWVILDAQRSVQYKQIIASQEIQFDQLWFLRNKTQIELPADTFEYAVSIAASAIKYYIRLGITVGFACVGQQTIMIPPERGVRQMDKIMEILAYVKPEGKLPILGLMEGQYLHMSRGSTVVIITPSTKPELGISAESLMRRDMRPVFILVEPNSFGSDKSAKEIYFSLQKRHITAAVIGKNDNLKKAMENAFLD